MAQIRPKTQTSSPADPGTDKVIVRPDGRMVCPNGYELLEEDNKGAYRCSGGAHRYQIPPDSVCKDKFGQLYVNPASSSCSGEEK